MQFQTVFIALSNHKLRETRLKFSIWWRNVKMCQKADPWTKPWTKPKKMNKDILRAASNHIVWQNSVTIISAKSVCFFLRRKDLIRSTAPLHQWHVNVPQHAMILVVPHSSRSLAAGIVATMAISATVLVWSL